MLATNKKNTTIPEECKWTPNFATAIKSKMTANMTGGSGAREGKHHDCRGKYFGFGLITKYKLRNNLSVYEFAGNDSEELIKSQLLNILQRDIQYVIERHHAAFPNAVYCGFIIISTIAQIIYKHPKECQEIIKLFQTHGIDQHKMSISNWACLDAETGIFHQECDSSYTLLSVPVWNFKKCNDAKQNPLKIGGANFVFKWASQSVTGHDVKYLPVYMYPGVSILFSGFGCYHCQHKTDKNTF